MGTFLGREPVAIAAFLAIAINLAISFGLNLTPDQVALINALVIAGLALLVRGSVTAPGNLPGTTVKTSASGETTVSKP
jgi:hypothetical protein